MTVNLQETIERCEAIAKKLETIPHIRPCKEMPGLLVPQICVERSKKENLEQLIPFCQEVCKRLSEYLMFNSDVSERYRKIEMKYQQYKDLTTDQVLKDGYTRITDLKKVIQEMETEIFKLKEKKFINHDESIKIFEEVEKEDHNISMDQQFSDLNDLIEEKCAFEVEGVSTRECDIIEEIVTFLENH